MQPYRSKYDDRFTVPRFKASKQRYLALHHIHGLTTWMIDLEEKLTPQVRYVMNVIHCNSRYWIPCILRSKNNEEVLDAFIDIKDQIEREKPGSLGILISDADSTITKGSVKLACNIFGIQMIVNDMSGKDARHTFNSIIDRISRTLRDFIYNIQFRDHTFQLNSFNLAMIANIYNTTPHSTLSKTMGFPVTPLNVIQNTRLQEEIVRRWTIDNIKIVESLAVTSIKPGTRVWIVQPIAQLTSGKRRNTVEDYQYIVTERQGAKYHVFCPITGVIKWVYRNDIVL